MSRRLQGLLLCALFVSFGLLVRVSSVEANVGPLATDRQVSAAAFETMMPVLRYPRCMNCHMSGDFPRQGDASHPHIMDVRRGPDGHGVNAVKCSTCHQEHNLPGVHMPPGAPEWSLPSPAMPMIWEGLSDHELCELLKDPKQNGHRTVEQIVEHMHTPLVLWGWNPGEGRTPIPYPKERFLEAVKVWAEHGAACPAERAISLIGNVHRSGSMKESEPRVRSIGNLPTSRYFVTDRGVHIRRRPLKAFL